MVKLLRDEALAVTEQLVHIGAIAALLLIAYVLGWSLGYALHRAMSRRPVLPTERAAPAVASLATDPGLAATAGSAPVAATPAIPVEIGATIPEPMRLGQEPGNAGLIESPQTVSALETLKSLSTAIPLVPAAIGAPEPTTPEAAVVPAVVAVATERGPASDDREQALAVPAAGSEPALMSLELPSARIAPAMPTVTPGLAWSGQLNGREAAPFDAPLAAARISAGDPENGDVSVPVANVPVPVVPSPDERPVSKPQNDTGPSESSSSPEAADSPRAASPVADAERLNVVSAGIDEDSAMRDIEGGWSRRGARTTGGMTEVSAAVNAAQVAVEQVLARRGVDPDPAEMTGQVAFGRPRGLPAPRDGRRDDLKQIVGLGPMDESALNNLGIYHFDQIANLDEREVLWLENHAFARGRIGREEWQRQARQLGIDTAALRIGR